MGYYIIYLTGFILCFIAERWSYKTYMEKRTWFDGDFGDYFFIFLWSLLSWIGLFITMVQCLFNGNSDDIFD